MRLNELSDNPGATKKRKRVARGPGSGTGKTAGRGHKGAGSRAGFGGSIHPLYEGGQMPYFRRIPKRGFTNAMFKQEFHVLNVKTLEARFADGQTVDAESLKSHGLIDNSGAPIKILGEGELTKKLNVVAAKFSSSARDKIEKAGGTVTVDALPDRAALARAKRGSAKKAKPQPQAASAAESAAESAVATDQPAKPQAAEPATETENESKETE